MQANGPVALLVGAGDAIGAAVARRFAAGEFAGLRRPARRRQGAKADRRGRGQPAVACSAFSVDARQEGEIQALFATSRRRRAHRGLSLQCRLEREPAAGRDDRQLFRKAWELACYGGFLTGREAARYMVPRGHGTILFTGATASMRGGPGSPPSPRRSSACARWPSRWRASLAPGISMSPIC